MKIDVYVLTRATPHEETVVLHTLTSIEAAKIAAHEDCETKLSWVDEHSTYLSAYAFDQNFTLYEIVKHSIDYEPDKFLFPVDKHLLRFILDHLEDDCRNSINENPAQLWAGTVRHRLSSFRLSPGWLPIIDSHLFSIFAAVIMQIKEELIKRLEKEEEDVEQDK